MGLDSYLELFTTLYGWTVANLIYNILLDTGIVFIPLIVTIVSVWMEAHVDGTENGGPQWAIRKMEIELMSALFVMAVCFVPTPFTTLDRASLMHTPTATAINPSPATATGNNSNSTFDAAFPATVTGASTPVPLWWYTVMGLSSGINSAVRAGIGNGLLGLRQAEQTARLAVIEDPALRAEAQNFRSQCWEPAHGQYHSLDRTPSPFSDVLNDALYGRDDTEWIGSQLFLRDPQYYESHRARQPIRGFAAQPLDDDKDKRPDEDASMPNCKRWWSESDIGLRERILNSGGRMNKAIAVTSAVLGANVPEGPMQDLVLKQALYGMAPNFMDSDAVIGGANASRSGGMEFLSKMGVAWKGLEASFSYYPITQFLTMAQPLILMSVYMFLPLVIVFSRFSLTFMFYGAITIFTVKFWAAMWSVARYIDERLVTAMYGDSTVLVREFLTNGLDGGSKRMILNFLTLGLFGGLPLVWSGLMALVGIQVGGAVSNALNSAVNAGTEAGKAARSGTIAAGKFAYDRVKGGPK